MVCVAMVEWHVAAVRCLSALQLQVMGCPNPLLQEVDFGRQEHIGGHTSARPALPSQSTSSASCLSLSEGHCTVCGHLEYFVLFSDWL